MEDEKKNQIMHTTRCKFINLPPPKRIHKYYLTPDDNKIFIAFRQSKNKKKQRMHNLFELKMCVFLINDESELMVGLYRSARDPLFDVHRAHELTSLAADDGCKNDVAMAIASFLNFR